MKQEFPRSAREALARQTAADEHPSADLLNGFLERALGADENARVSAHLASCADCRDILFLADAANQDDQRAPTAQAWARWGAWKWLAPGMAVLAMVGGFLVERNGNRTALHPAGVTVATTTPSSNTMRPPAAAPTMQARNTVPDELTSAASQRSFDRKPEQLKKETDTASVPHQQSRALNPSAGIARSKDQNVAELGQASPPPPPAVARSAGLQTPEPTAMAKAAAPANAVSPPREVPLQAASDATHTARQPMAAVSSTAGAHKAAGIASGGVFGAVLSANPATTAAPHWRISSDGHLEHSTSSGEWTRALADQPISFRTVAVIGRQVWAGGSDGALFHSSDAGENWTQVALMADGQPERGAVQSIRFDSSSQGRVVTDAGTTWSTQDGGQTWTRQ